MYKEAGKLTLGSSKDERRDFWGFAPGFILFRKASDCAIKVLMLRRLRRNSTLQYAFLFTP
jgi:hypothetical protein